MTILTNYHVSRITTWLRRIFLGCALLFLAGNLVSLAIGNPIRVNPGSYTMKQGYPLFTSGEEYIRMMKKYPHRSGVTFRIYRTSMGESLWDIAFRNQVSIDTLIAANPFLKSLLPEEGTEIIIPSHDGVLLVYDDIMDVVRMSFQLKTPPTGRDFIPRLFHLISTDDVRIAFFPNEIPVVVNDSLEKLYSLRRVFRSPVRGAFSSLFGDRVDPILDGMAFHNGVDIMCSYNTPLHPTRDGMVVFAGWRDGYGKMVVIQHDDGYGSLYAHCSSLKVSEGDWVTVRDTIALAGSTGRSTGSHLHFTLWRHGIIINPLLVIW